MSLKTEPFEWNGETVTLNELSALQRILHLEYLKKIAKIDDGDFQKAMAETIRTAAFVVAMSLWHTHELKGKAEPKPDHDAEVILIQNEIMMSWAPDAIAAADYSVKLLSGMIQPPGEEDETVTDEPVTVEKSSPVS